MLRASCAARRRRVRHRYHRYRHSTPYRHVGCGFPPQASTRRSRTRCASSSSFSQTSLRLRSALRLRSHDRAPINSLKLRQPGARCGRTLCRARHDPSGPWDEAARSSPRRPLGPAVRSRNAHALALARDRRGAPGPVRAVGCGRKDLLRDHRLARQQRRRSGGAALRWLRRAAQRSGGRQGSVCGAVVRRLGCRARKSPDGTGPWSG